LQEGLSGAAFHPLDDNLLITHGRGHLAFWHRRKDGFFEKTDIIKPVMPRHEPFVELIDGFHSLYDFSLQGLT
jgi:echinoderm microtubule-associated protein-like 1/2